MLFLHIQDTHKPEHDAWAKAFAEAMGKQYRGVDGDDLVQLRDPDGFSQWLQDEAIDLIILSVENDRHSVQGYLNAFRSLRIPYIFLTDEMQMPCVPMATVLAPVTMLEEEVHKAEILNHLIRFMECRVVLLQAKGYGPRAGRNTGRIVSFLEHQGQRAEVLMAKRDSSSIHKELPERQQETEADMLVVTASREYGLDDIIFGPAERTVVQKSCVPVMLLNPRGDLFSLCD